MRSLLPHGGYSRLHRIKGYACYARLSSLFWIGGFARVGNRTIRCSFFSVVIEKRCPFTVFADDRAFLSNTPVLSKELRSSNDERCNKEYTGNDKGKDPLEGNDMDLELGDGDGCIIGEHVDILNKHRINLPKDKMANSIPMV